MSIDWSLHIVASLLFGAFYILALWNCVRILGDRLSSGAAIAWILINLGLPFVGVPLYLLFGNLRIRGYVKRHRAGAALLEGSEPTPPDRQPVKTSSLQPPLAENVESFGRSFSKFGSLFDPQYGTVELLIDGESTFEAIFSAIAAAKKYILVQYYILRSDRLGLELKRLLIERAREGIPVYLLCDDMGSFWLSNHYLADLTAAGVKVERFLPIASFKRFFQLNFRNHRKLVVVDGESAFTGGLNVGEEYAARRRQRRPRVAPPSSRDKLYWRDTHVKLTGGIISRLEDLFLEDWYFATGDVKTLEKLIGSETPQPPSDTVTQLIPTGPTDDTLISVLFLTHLINSAKNRLWIATPYFVPDQVLVKALELAALRGVDVRIIIPKVSDNILVHWVSLSYAEQMQQKGVIVLLYGVGFMHQKTILVDDSIATVGTMNIDNRALYLNFETMVLIHSTTFAAAVEEMLLRDFLSCRFLKVEKNKYSRSLHRARAAVARLLAPLL